MRDRNRSEVELREGDEYLLTLTVGQGDTQVHLRIQPTKVDHKRVVLEVSGSVSMDDQPLRFDR